MPKTNLVAQATALLLAWKSLSPDKEPDYTNGFTAYCLSLRQVLESKYTPGTARYVQRQLVEVYRASLNAACASDQVRYTFAKVFITELSTNQQLYQLPKTPENLYCLVTALVIYALHSSNAQRHLVDMVIREVFESPETLTTTPVINTASSVLGALVDPVWCSLYQDTILTAEEARTELWSNQPRFSALIEKTFKLATPGGQMAPQPTLSVTDIAPD